MTDETPVMAPADVMAYAFRLLINPNDINTREVPLICGMATRAGAQPVALLHFVGHETLRERIATALLRDSQPTLTLLDLPAEQRALYYSQSDAVLRVLA